MDRNAIERKLLRDPIAQLIRSVMAGMFISIGAAFMLTCKHDGMGVFACGIAFSLGLWLVTTCNGELFTGNCLLLPYMGNGLRVTKVMCDGTKEEIGEFSTTYLVLKNLVISLIGNVIGALFMVFIIRDTNIVDVAQAVASTKIAARPAEVFCKAFLCNICVCLSVYVSFGAKNALEKLAACILPIACFVACGWEHSIADMFILPLGRVEPSIAVPFIFEVAAANTIGGWLTAELLCMSESTTDIVDMSDGEENE